MTNRRTVTTTSFSEDDILHALYNTYAYAASEDYEVSYVHETCYTPTRHWLRLTHTETEQKQSWWDKLCGRHAPTVVSVFTVTFSPAEIKHAMSGTYNVDVEDITLMFHEAKWNKPDDKDSCSAKIVVTEYA